MFLSLAGYSIGASYQEGPQGGVILLEPGLQIPHLPLVEAYRFLAEEPLDAVHEFGDVGFEHGAKEGAVFNLEAGKGLGTAGGQTKSGTRGGAPHRRGRKRLSFVQQTQGFVGHLPGQAGVEKANAGEFFCQSESAGKEPCEGARAKFLHVGGREPEPSLRVPEPGKGGRRGLGAGQIALVIGLGFRREPAAFLAALAWSARSSVGKGPPLQARVSAAQGSEARTRS